MEEVYIFLKQKTDKMKKNSMDLSYDWVVHERLLKFK